MVISNYFDFIFQSCAAAIIEQCSASGVCDEESNFELVRQILRNLSDDSQGIYSLLWVRFDVFSFAFIFQPNFSALT